VLPGEATDILKKSRLSWKLKISNAAVNADITQSQARSTRHLRMQEVNSLCMDSGPLWANTVLCHSTQYSLLVLRLWAFAEIYVCVGTKFLTWLITILQCHSVQSHDHVSGFLTSDGKGFSPNTCSTQKPGSKDLWSCSTVFSTITIMLVHFLSELQKNVTMNKWSRNMYNVYNSYQK